MSKETKETKLTSGTPVTFSIAEGKIVKLSDAIGVSPETVTGLHIKMSEITRKVIKDNTDDKGVLTLSMSGIFKVVIKEFTQQEMFFFMCHTMHEKIQDVLNPMSPNGIGDLMEILKDIRKDN